MTPTISSHHIFVDFENVPDVDFTGLGDRVVKVTLFVGAKQKRIDATIVEQLVEKAEHVQLVRLTSSGKNALDFTLAYYLGRGVSDDPMACFHVVSKDQGFDPLIAHLNRLQTKVVRHNAFSDAIAQIVGRPRSLKVQEKAKPLTAPPPPVLLPATAAPANKTSVEEVWAYLKQKDAHRAKTRTKLRSLLKNHFHFREDDLDAIILALDGAHIDIDTKDKVTYRL